MVEDRFPVYKDPILPRGSKFCPVCSVVLNTTGWQKPMYPPLDVVQCVNCRVEYWLQTEPKGK